MRHTSHFIDMDDENIKVRSVAENIYSVQLNVYFCLFCLLLLGNLLDTRHTVDITVVTVELSRRGSNQVPNCNCQMSWK